VPIARFTREMDIDSKMQLIKLQWGG